MLNLEERSRRLQAYLPQIAPEGLDLPEQSSLEAMGPSDRVQESTARGLENLESGRVLEVAQADALEAIVHKTKRPAINIMRDTYQEVPKDWKGVLDDQDVKNRLSKLIPSVGRIELPGDLLVPYGGTGFVVGKDLIMTNRHVAEIFTMGLGVRNLKFKPHRSSAINFRKELFQEEDLPDLAVQEVVMIHPYWDMALLRVVGLQEHHAPLPLAVVSPEDIVGHNIAVIGYPAQDDRNDLDLQNKIYGGVFNIKRLQPGKAREVQPIGSFNHTVRAMTHDASTLGGCSGSMVVDIDSGEVVGLHFAGIYLEANYAVPTFELARDARVVDAGLSFRGAVAPTSDWDAAWKNADFPGESLPTLAAVSKRSGAQAITSSPTAMASNPATTVNVTAGGITFTVPLQITVSLGSIAAGAPPVPPPPSVTTEGLFGGGGDNEQEIIDRAYARFKNTSYAGSQFSWELALATCATSHLVYSEGPRVSDVCQNQWDFDSCEFIQVNDTECFVAVTEEAMAVAFRGTAGVRDWLRDLTLFSTSVAYGTVHQGFFHGFQQVRAALETAMRSFGLGDRKLVISGHSLGGALATIAAAEWIHAGEFEVAGIYTFGQPAVGKKDFREFINGKTAGKFFRFVNEDDIVPRVPPNYVHVGKLMQLDRRGNTESLEALAPEPETMSETEFHILQERLDDESRVASGVVATEGLIPSISDHGLHNYLNKILSRIS
ncbi:Lipase (class 3) [Bremerella volcania]|uniref:Lipase (Class 3) n=1 Tax=Bremerella volcania TaxID=2527984 RepID=A0A518C777_9BACT|nr:trypsin-like peptidase domain-containing protein [Bremerella volcania]QDU75054.1 Lipase (class 3) [Bremerella volcania]